MTLFPGPTLEFCVRSFELSDERPCVLRVRARTRRCVGSPPAHTQQQLTAASTTIHTTVPTATATSNNTEIKQIRQAWDRDVVGGDWEDLKLEWVGKPQGPDGVLVGDERGRVVIRSRRINGYVSWNGSRFTHVPGREGATVFMLQRMASSSGGGGGGGSGGASTSLSASNSSTSSRRTRQTRGER